MSSQQRNRVPNFALTKCNKSEAVLILVFLIGLANNVKA